MPREQFLLRRAAAYQAYYEHMPLPERMRPKGPDMRIHTQLDWGKLARFYTLDDRQYRSWHSCRRPGRTGGSNTVDIEKCERMFNPNRTMLGRAQERWRAWTDGWDGYPAARQRLLSFVSEKRIANPVVLGGDVHSFNVADLKLDFDEPASPVVASEFVGTSITSQAWAQEKLREFMPDNPHMKLVDSRYRGYVRVEITPSQMRADLRAMESVTNPDAACNTLASFVVEDGKAGPQRA